MQNNPVVSLYPAKGSFGIKGTGTFISPNTILTCEHVVGKCKEMNAIVWYDEGCKPTRWNKLVHVHATVLYTCKSLDFAILMVDESFHYAKAELEAPLDSIVEIICPHEAKSPYVGRIIASAAIADNTLERISYTIDKSALVPGTSGAPLMYNGKLVGLHWSVGGHRADKFKSCSLPFKHIYNKLQKQFNCFPDDVCEYISPGHITATQMTREGEKLGLYNLSISDISKDGHKLK